MKRQVALLAIFVISLGSFSQVECIDPTQIDPNAICTTEYAPVCGCDGIVYGNACNAYYYGGVTSWTDGQCGPDTLGCFDLAGLDFGDCEMILGIGVVNGSCAAVSGCSFVDSNGYNYEAAFYSNLEDCQNACETSGCIDESVIIPDFICDGGNAPVCGCDGVSYMNACEAYYHNGVIEWTEGPCSCPDLNSIDLEMGCFALWDPVCGCDGNTYGNSCEAWYWYGITDWTAGECGEQECMDLGGIDFGLCDFPLGIAFINGQCESISGCDWEVDSVDYQPYFFETFEACQIACPEVVECMSLDSVDFGPCDAIIGVAWTSAGCVELSGCSQTGADGVDYSEYFFESLGECQMNCVPPLCVDPEQVDSSAVCLDIAEFVCGCDSVTYLNSCEAINYGGVTGYTDGICLEPIECVNEGQQDSTVACPDVWFPVCGCDGITYGNSCEAFFWGGIQTWIEGECDSVNVNERIPTTFVLYPNPTTGEVNLRFEYLQQSGSVSVLNLMGQSLMEMDIPVSGIMQIDLSDLPSGTYLLRHSENGLIRQTSRLIVNH